MNQCENSRIHINFKNANYHDEKMSWCKRKKIRHLKETILTQHPSKILSLLTSSGLTSHLATATYRCTLRPHNIAVGYGFQVQQSTFLTTPRGETCSKPPTREGRKTVLFTPMLNNSLRREKHSRKH